MERGRERERERWGKKGIDRQSDATRIGWREKERNVRKKGWRDRERERLGKIGIERQSEATRNGRREKERNVRKKQWRDGARKRQSDATRVDGETKREREKCKKKAMERWGKNEIE